MEAGWWRGEREGTSTGTERYERRPILDELGSRVPSLRDEFVGTGEACLYYLTVSRSSSSSSSNNNNAVEPKAKSSNSDRLTSPETVCRNQDRNTAWDISPIDIQTLRWRVPQPSRGNWGMQTQGLVDDSVKMRHRSEFSVVGEAVQRLQFRAQLGDFGGGCCEVVKEEDHGGKNCFTAREFMFSGLLC